jgi:hypothetical protein
MPFNNPRACNCRSYVHVETYGLIHSRYQRWASMPLFRCVSAGVFNLSKRSATPKRKRGSSNREVVQFHEWLLVYAADGLKLFRYTFRWTSCVIWVDGRETFVSRNGVAMDGTCEPAHSCPDCHIHILPRLSYDGTHVPIFVHVCISWASLSHHKNPL